MKFDEKITVLITTYNSYDTIASTIDSILKQSYSEIDILIIDDGSDEEFLNILDSYSNKNITVVKNQHSGRAKSLVLGVGLIKTNWMAICDSDDIWHPKKIEYQVSFINDNVDLISTSTKNFSDNNDILFEDLLLKDRFKIIKSEVISPRKLLFRNMISHSSVLIRTRWSMYNPNLKELIDYELWLRLIFIQKIKILKISPILTFHRIHKKQSFESRGFNYRLKSVFLSLSYCKISRNYDLIFVNFLKLFYYIFSRAILFFKVKL